VSIYISKYTLILILLGALALFIVVIVILLKMKKKKPAQESIPGMEEMAKTTFFWSDYHRGKIENRTDKSSRK